MAFDAVSQGIEQGAGTVIIDTGRLHTKTGLMDELGKVKRVVEKKAQVDEVLVLDATTGQERPARRVPGRQHHRHRADKMDGTAKGSIIIQVQRELRGAGQTRRAR